MATKTIKDIEVSGKTVLMRVDFNVPLDGGKVTDDARIRAALPSIRELLQGGGKLVLLSHLGRPKGEGFEAEFSLKPAAERLGELLDKKVGLGPAAVVGVDTEKMVGQLNDGDVMLLENLRFHPGETMPDKAKKNPDGKLTDEQQKTHDSFVEDLARLGRVYVNDAFGTCHRKHASMYGLPKAIQAGGGPAVAGFLVEREIQYLHEAVDNPVRPFLAILGGAKVSDKVQLIATLLKKVDELIIGGAMAYTLLKAKGVDVGASRVEDDQIDALRPLLDKAGEKIVLPVDHVSTDDFEKGKPTKVDGQEIPEGMMGMDIGPKTAAEFKKHVAKAKTIVWNGPMGVFERKEYAAGTEAVAAAVADATGAGAISVIGGGDSAAAVAKMGLSGKMTHVSTGGGASLTYLEGKPMAAIEVLDSK